MGVQTRRGTSLQATAAWEFWGWATRFGSCAAPAACPSKPAPLGHHPVMLIACTAASQRRAVQSDCDLKAMHGRRHASGARNSASRQAGLVQLGGAFCNSCASSPDACVPESRHQRRRMVEEKMWLRRWAAAEPKLNRQGTWVLRAAALPKLHLVGAPLSPSAVVATSSSSSSATFLAATAADRSTRAPSPAAETVMAAAASSRLGGRAGGGAGQL